ncbi:MAG: glycosyltransferase family 4 protein [Blautia sp.]|nr:glycosyltransferase family 4 protein [Blautia sp.]MCM1202166.1 glycosyltransferase family 4 protein [Bacteroides fragilis]
MKIAHICLCGAYTDGFQYQENLLSKYHKRLGNEVTVIASQWGWNSEGKVERKPDSLYRNEDGVKVIRLPVYWGNVHSRLKIYKGLYRAVESEQADILFIHDCQFPDLTTIARYLKRNPGVTAYVDNHVDFLNGAHGWLSKNILHGCLWKHCIHKIEPYVKKFYGVVPARVDFLTDLYGIPENRCELLLMGADDDFVEKADSPESKRRIREKFGVKRDDFLIVTGGKMNSCRYETLNLLKAVKKIRNEKVKLLLFGSIAEEIREEFDGLIDNEKIQFAGWQDAPGTYEMMAAADLAVFPGLHSVMWEQAVALGVPCVCRNLSGFHHIDTGGNVRYLETSGEEEIYGVLSFLLTHPESCRKMYRAARSERRKDYLYSKIANKIFEAEMTKHVGNSI